MYFIDTPTGCVDQFEFDAATGSLGARRTFVAIPADQGAPDGLVVDADGGIWVALWNGSAVHRYRPDGSLDITIDLPVSLVTKCGFGGPALEDLYITTARMYLDGPSLAGQPHAGSVFRVRPGVKGRPAARFGG
jgi:sugar lactone lactonase YvrE